MPSLYIPLTYFLTDRVDEIMPNRLGLVESLLLRDSVSILTGNRADVGQVPTRRRHACWRQIDSYFSRAINSYKYV